MGRLFTIGHSLHDREYVLSLLNKYGIDNLIDVRSYPYSRYAPQFNREAFEEYLKGSPVAYSFMGRCFGARRSDPGLYDDEGLLDFEKTRESAAFQWGFENIMKGLEKHDVALMCTEKDPFDCHRAIMVARGFALEGVEVNHILADGLLMSHAALDERLLDKYFPGHDQLSLLEEDNVPHEELVRLAYRKRNKEIGWKLTGIVADTNEYMEEAG